MKKGQTVKSLKLTDVHLIFEYLEKRNLIVMLGVVKFSLNTGLRISDVLNLTFDNLNSSYIKEQKTKKSKDIVFNRECIKTADMLKEFYKIKHVTKYDSGYLFKSFKKTGFPISYQGVNFYIKQIREDLNINYAFNTHSFRKTWAKEVYNKYNNLVLVMKALNHINPSVTLRYIGIDEEEFKKIYKNITF